MTPDLDALRAATLDGAASVIHDLCQLLADGSPEDEVAGDGLAGAAAVLGEDVLPHLLLSDEDTGLAALVVALDALDLAVADLGEQPDLVDVAVRLGAAVAARVTP